MRPPRRNRSPVKGAIWAAEGEGNPSGEHHSCCLLRSLRIDHLMGDAKIKPSTTKKFIEQYPDCCFCGGVRRAATREHMPPKALFDGSHRPDKLIMPACEECNQGSKIADLTASILSRWQPVAFSDQQRQDHQRLVGGVRNNNP
jgi:hypothetical protein